MCVKSCCSCDISPGTWRQGMGSQSSSYFSYTCMSTCQNMQLSPSYHETQSEREYWFKKIIHIDQCLNYTNQLNDEIYMRWKETQLFWTGQTLIGTMKTLGVLEVAAWSHLNTLALLCGVKVSRLVYSHSYSIDKGPQKVKLSGPECFNIIGADNIPDWAHISSSWVYAMKRNWGSSWP